MPEPRLSPVEDWPDAERLVEERIAVGFYLSRHPLEDYVAPLKRKGIVTIDELQEKALQGPLIAKVIGEVAGRQERKSARGNRFAFVQMSDPTSNYEVTLFSEAYTEFRELLVKDTIVIAEGRISTDDRTGNLAMRASGLRSLTEARQNSVSDLTIEVSAEKVNEQFADLLCF